jgi:hypothetical protein
MNILEEAFDQYEALERSFFQALEGTSSCFDHKYVTDPP